MSFKYSNDTKTLFKINDNDISMISRKDILVKLPTPEILITRDRLEITNVLLNKFNLSLKPKCFNVISENITGNLVIIVCQKLEFS